MVTSFPQENYLLPIDDRFVFDEAKYSRFFVTFLRFRSNRTDFDESKTYTLQRRNSFAIFIETSSDTDGISKW